jgi:hypothetical protein
MKWVASRNTPGVNISFIEVINLDALEQAQWTQAPRISNGVSGVRLSSGSTAARNGALHL